MKAQLFKSQTGCVVVIEGYGNIPFPFAPQTIIENGVEPFQNGCYAEYSTEVDEMDTPEGESLLDFEV